MLATTALAGRRGRAAAACGSTIACATGSQSWTGDERQPVTIQDLLEHCSGLPAHRPYWEQRRGRASFELAICEEPLDYLPRTQSIYSDPGFMLLGFAIEHAAGAPLDQLFDEWRSRELGHGVELAVQPAGGLARANRADRGHAVR